MRALVHRTSSPAASSTLAGHGRARVARRALAVAGFVASLVAADAVRADICKYADADGNVHYSNVAPEKGWRRLSCPVGGNSTTPGGGKTSGTTSRSAPSPAGFPRVDPDTQRTRDDVRRKVLSDELAAEAKLLAEARTQYADGAPTPLAEERADAEKYRARIARLRQAVGIHEKNVEALKKELATIK